MEKIIMEYATNSSDASDVYSDTSASNISSVINTAENGNLGDMIKNSYIITEVIIRNEKQDPRNQ